MRRTSKVNVLLADFERSPAPFVWIDDQINWRHQRRLQETLKDEVAYLLIKPDPNEGLTHAELDTVEAFVAEHGGMT